LESVFADKGINLVFSEHNQILLRLRLFEAKLSGSWR
jgi:hypothetical protein